MAQHYRQGQEPRREAVPKVARLILLALVSCALGVALCFAIAQVRGPFSSGGWFNRFWVAFFAALIFVVGSFVVCRDWLAEKPERIYLIVVLCVTTLFAWSFSTRAVGWDTGIHYRNVVRLVDWEGEVDTTQADETIMAESPLEASQDSSLGTIDAHEDALDADDGRSVGTIDRPTNPLTYVTGIEYVPYALVMVACRAVGLSASRTLLLVRLAGGLFYSVITFLGMRKLRWGKMLYAALCLLPTSVFLAAELGYSYWLFSLCLYGFASLVAMMQGSVEVHVSSLAQMIVVLFIGMLPRVVYFPLMFLCLLIPTERFPRRHLALAYRAFIVCAAIAAFAVWLVPRLLSGMGTGDARGGEVNPAGQIAYILSHPLEYARTFARFVLPPLAMQDGAPDVEGYNLVGGFLSVEASPGLLANYGYLPRAPWPFTAALWAILGWVTLTDKDSDQRLGVASGIVSLILTFGVFVMIVTALYFDFTPVGLDEIHGVQRRYLLPLLYPLLVFVGPGAVGLTGERARVSKAAYDGAVLVGMAAILLGSFWCSCVSLIV